MEINVFTAASSTRRAIQTFGSGDFLGMSHDDSHLFSLTQTSTGTYFVFPLVSLHTKVLVTLIDGAQHHITDTIVSSASIGDTEAFPYDNLNTLPLEPCKYSHMSHL